MKYRCDNCGSTAKPAIPWECMGDLSGDITDRLDVGGVVPAGECKCGALTYLVKAEAKPKVLLTEQAANRATTAAKAVRKKSWLRNIKVEDTL